MIDVKQATQIALKYFSELNPGMFERVALEEVEKSVDEKDWLVTLGYSLPSLLLLAGTPPQREYKEIRIDATNGNVVSMKIKKI